VMVAGGQEVLELASFSFDGQPHLIGQHFMSGMDHVDSSLSTSSAFVPEFAQERSAPRDALAGTRSAKVALAFATPAAHDRAFMEASVGEETFDLFAHFKDGRTWHVE